MAVKRSSNMAVLVVLVLVVSMAVTSPVAKSQALGGLFGGLLGGGNGGTGNLLGGLLGGGTGNLLGGLLGGGNGNLLGGLLGGGTGGLGSLLSFILGPINQITGSLFNITGSVFCSANATTSAPPFANAVVLLQCNGTIVANTTTNSNGSFSIILNAANTVLASFLRGCRIIIPTPLSSCNATLPATGGLVAPLQAIGNSTIGGGLNVVNIIPLTFKYFSDILSLLLGGTPN